MLVASLKGVGYFLTLTILIHMYIVINSRIYIFVWSICILFYKKNVDTENSVSECLLRKILWVFQLGMCGILSSIQEFHSQVDVAVKNIEHRPRSRRPGVTHLRVCMCQRARGGTVCFKAGMKCTYSIDI
jgi:hypothetical protein